MEPQVKENFKISSSNFSSLQYHHHNHHPINVQNTTKLQTRYPEFTWPVARLECRLQNVYVFVQLIYVYVLCKSSLIGYHQGAFGPVWQVHQNDDIREPFKKRNYLKTFINPPQPPYFP